MFRDVAYFILDMILGGMSEVCPAEILCDLFLIAVVDQKVLGLVSCPAKINSTAVFSLRNGRFSSLRELTRPHTP